jgi:hypothetical protein
VTGARAVLSRKRLGASDRVVSRTLKAATVVATVATAFLGCAAVATAVPTAAPRPGLAGASGGGRTLAVSVPPVPTLVAPGGTAAVPIRIVNPGTTPVTVTLAGRQIELGDNGSVRLIDGPDPLWNGRVDFPVGPLVLPGHSFRTITVRLRIPQRIDPDLYFVGFVTTPSGGTAGSVQVRNQVGSFVSLDVPGPRLRDLRAALSAPRVHFGSKTTVNLRVSNPGHAVVRFFGENDVSTSPGTGRPQQQRFEPAILPVGRHRSIHLVATSDWPVGFVRMTVRLTYPGQLDSSTKDVVVSTRVLVVRPWVPAALALIVLAAGAWLVRRHLTRRQNRRSGLAVTG